MKCLWHYEWVKLPRNRIPKGKGILGDWARLASRAAFRKGTALYCGYENTVVPGMWAGGVVGLKSILGTKSRQKALDTVTRLQELGYISWELNEDNKKFSYHISDWVMKCSGEACMKGSVYTTEGYGFLCMPRNISERLVKQNYIFEEADAWMDLWCHTVTEDPNNVFSQLAPSIQFGKYGAVLTLEKLGQRWGWEKTKVWRFFQKHKDTFALYRLSSSYGCIIFNQCYPTEQEIVLPEQGCVNELVDKIKEHSAEITKQGSESEHLSQMVAWYSRKMNIVHDSDLENTQAEGKERVALSASIIYTYISLCICKNCKNDCRKVNSIDTPSEMEIRGPCVDLEKLGKEILEYEYFE